jgi:8-oxo-dGTP pyrophosphatase MutT (NUDIX family)
MDALPLTPGAVLVPIFAKAPHGVLFVERATHLRRHAGQIGLPGGRADPIDGGDPERTALRELFEELGIESDRVTVVGRLPALEQSSSRFVITPIVGVVDPGVAVRPDGNEIAGFFDVPLAAIVADGALYDDAATGRARGRAMYALDYAGRHIWGFTARILKSFVDEWNAAGSPLRRAIVTSLRD